MSPRLSARPTRPRLAILALALGGFGIGTTEFVTMGLLPQIAAGTGVDIPTAGHYVSAYAVGVVVGAPTLAVLFAKAPRKGLLMALMAAFALANAASGLVSGYGPLMVARFVSGLPHGAYFGIAMLVAAGLVDTARRTSAVAMILGGLAVANVIGVPLATWLGQRLGWSVPYLLVAVIGAVTVVAIAVWVPRQRVDPGASWREELGALRHTQVWLALLMGVVGFGGMFATYAYIAPTLTDLAGLSSAAVPVALVVYGVGMVTGMTLAGRVSRRVGVLRGIAGTQLAVMFLLAIFGSVIRLGWTAWPLVYLLGVLPSILVPLLQTRLMDVAHDGQALAATLNHATLNLANALGPWLGSLVLAAGWGLVWPSRIGAVLAAAGLVITLVATVLQRRQQVGRSGPASA